MKELLENYIKFSNNYIDYCSGGVYVNLDREIVLDGEDPVKALHEAGKALRKAAKAKGVDMRELKEHLIMFILANTSRMTRPNMAEYYEERVAIRIKLLEVFLGIK